MPPPPPSSANHGLFVDLHPSIGETTPQSTVVFGDLVEPSEPKKKKPRKLNGKSTKFTKINGPLGLSGLSLCIQQMVK